MFEDNSDDLTTAYLVGYEKAKDEYKPRWRKYPEEKPKHNQRILVYMRGVWHGAYQCVICDDCYYDSYRFSHWMPIPEIGE